LSDTLQIYPKSDRFVAAAFSPDNASIIPAPVQVAHTDV
jgi:hypothetical protein